MDNITKHDNFDIDFLEPSPTNAKLHTPLQVDAIAASIAKYGFVQPVIVDHKNEIVVGHGRVLAARQLHLKTVPVWVLSEAFTAEEIEALRVADNKLNHDTGFDMAKLQPLMETLGKNNAELMAKLNLKFDFTKIFNKPPRKVKAATNDKTVIVECKAEDEAKALFQELSERGLTCRMIG